MKTIDYWKGKGGDEYTKRNRVDWQARIPFWKMILDKTGARSVFEFGCNVGWNLSAIQRIYPDVVLQGAEINRDARFEASLVLPKVDIWDDSVGHVVGIYYTELVFTAGVLIHIPPEEIKETMSALVDISLDYILAIEYYAEEETEIEYQGEMGLLWKRPYGKLYEEMGLEWVDGDYPAVGFDGCQWDLLRK